MSFFLPISPPALARLLLVAALVTLGGMLWVFAPTPTSRAVELPPLAAAAPQAATTTYGSYFVQLEGAPVALFYAELLQDENAHSASINAATQTQLASVEAAQLQLVAALANHDAQVLYRVQRVLNGIAVYVPVEEVAALAALPGVQGVYPLIPKEPTNARADTLLNAPAIWEGIERAGLTGQGVRIAIIDTGIDYLHTHFGGPGTGYLLNDPAVVGDAANFPGPKVVGGYDFAGDSYDASPTSINYQPVPAPDPDPMDCYSFGHGTHVAGTAAGYGVLANGTTYTGPYDSAINLNSFRIGPGLAPEASIYALKVFGCTGSSNVVDAAVEWAVDPNGDGDFSDRVDVINLSLGSNFGSEFDATAIAVENAAKLGIIVVTSAGNTGDVHYAIGSPGVATRALAVAATSIDLTDPDNLGDGATASFSARGPRRGDHALKPDLAAPGVNIISARRGTGSQSVTSSGTSMAAPVVAGIMALLRQAYPEGSFPAWRNYELKALVMNTAVYPLLRPDNLLPYSQLRVGAGRIDPTRALQSNLIAYDAAAPEGVSVSFGAIEVVDSSVAVRAVRLANKGTQPISVTVGYSAVRTLPGVSIDVGAGRVITVPALGFVTIAITLTADAAQMRRQTDSTRQFVPTNAYPWLDETSGYLSFTPVITRSGPTIHLPIHALPRIQTALTAVTTPLDLGNRVTATFPLTVAGSAITGEITDGMTTTGAPTRTVPLLGIFGLAHSSPPITEAPNGDPLLERYAQADLRYVGTAGPLFVNGERTLYFALVSYGPWSTPLEVTYQIAIDTDGDNVTDFRLQNREATDISAFDFGTTDDFVSLLERVGGTRLVQGRLNLYPPTEYDTRPFASNVMVLPLRLDDLGGNVTTLRYQVTSTSRDIITGEEPATVEETPILTLSVDGEAGITTTKGVPLFPVTVGEEITLTFDRAAYIRQGSNGLLLLYWHNDLATRSQTLPVQFTWDHSQYLPGIMVNGE